MHISKVTATAFGALSDQTLELAPGLTVVAGRNESAKSTWHAATYAALCGRRRGAGATTNQMRAFRDRHRPWTGNRWAVSAELTLEDGRRIHLSHDLDGKVDCRATDLGLGRDASAEIIRQGSPDGSVWLGLDRESFAATACVNQADVLGVLNRADGLQTDLQRAAANAGAADPTAAQALAAMDDFLREHVGVDRAGIRKPLRAAKEQLAQAQTKLERARSGHEAYLCAVEDAEGKRSEADAAQAEVGTRAAHHNRLLELGKQAQCAARAREEAQRAAKACATRGELVQSQRRDLARAHDLHDLLGGREPRSQVDSEVLATAAASAVHRWTATPDPIALTDQPEVARAIDVGPAALRDLASRVEAAPSPVAARAAREEAGSGLLAAEAALQAARSCHANALAAIESAEDDRRRAQEQVNAATAWSAADGGGTPQVNLPLGVAAVFLGIVGAGLLTTQIVIGVALLAVGVALAIVTLRGNRRPGAPSGDSGPGADKLRRGRQALADAEGRLPGARDHERKAAASLSAADRAVGVAQERLASAEAMLRTTEVVWSHLDRQCAEVGGGADPGQLRSMALRAELAGAAAAAAAHARADALQGLVDAAFELGLRPSVDAASEDEAEALVESLAQWLAERRQDLARAESDRRAWAGLQAILAGRTLEELDDLVAAAEQELRALAGQARAADDQAAAAEAGVAELAAEAGFAELAGARLHTPVDPSAVEAAIQASLADLTASTERATQLTAAADQAEGALTERARTLPSVPEAEEALAAAEAEQARVLELSTTLSTARDFLIRAQESVHRDIAPVLAATLTRWLPRVTEGRYVEALIDPASLKVQVRPTGGDWIEATRLSLGTAEQVYLLLHVALAEHLGDPGEPCPLLLDDVTVQADGVRTVEILETLLCLAEDRQVVLFAQEADVLRWARKRLASDDRHAIIELEQVQVR